MNYNVILTLITDFFNTLTDSLLGFLIINNFIYKLSHNGKLIGNFNSISFLVSIPFIIISGILSDKFKRSYSIKFGGLSKIIINLFLLRCLKYIDSNNILIIFLIYFIIDKISSFIIEPSISSIYADSVSAIKRNQYEVFRLFSQNLGNILGYLINIYLFLINKNIWDLKTLNLIINYGCILKMFSSLIYLVFDDKKSLQTESLSIIEDVNKNKLIYESFNTKIKIKRKNIPYIILLSRFFFGAGAGFIMIFLPIFLKNNYTPILACIFYIFCNLCTLFVAQFIEKFRIKRKIVLMQLSTIIDIFLIYLTILLYPKWTEYKILLIFILLSRFIFASWHMPLTQTLYMDFSPKNKRAKFNSYTLIVLGLSSIFWIFVPKNLNSATFKLIFNISFIFKLLGIMTRFLLFYAI